MTGATVRQAVFADLEALTPLFDRYRQFYAQPSDPHAARTFLHARLAANESVLFIACDEELALGFVQLYPSFSSVSLGRTFILNDLFVIDAARRNGIASRLLDAALDYASGVGAIRVTLSTAVDNAGARALYESEGWQRDEKYYVYHFALGA